MKDKCIHHPCYLLQNNLLAPRGIACLLKRWEEDETARRLNVSVFSEKEKHDMMNGNMCYRHFFYDGYCQDIPFSYE